MDVPTDLCLITTLWNPTRSRRLIENYWACRRRMEASGLVLVTVELPFGVPEIPAGDTVVHARGGDVLWQKERLAQIGAEHALDLGYRKVLMIDADVSFRPSDWHGRVSEALDRFDVVHGLELAEQHYSDIVVKSGSFLLYRPPAVMSPWGVLVGLRNRIRKRWRGVTAGIPGFGIAMGMRDRFVREVGLYPFGLVGGSDLLHRIVLWEGQRRTVRSRTELARRLPELPSNALRAFFVDWMNAALAKGPWSVGCVRGVTAITAAHGALKRRSYFTRYQRITDLDPAKHLVIPEGRYEAIRWTESAPPSLRAAVEGYFSDRGVDE